MVGPGGNQGARACDGWVGAVKIDGDVDAGIGDRLVAVQAGTDRLVGVIEPRPHRPPDKDCREHDVENDPRCSARLGVTVRDALTSCIVEGGIMAWGWHVAHSALGRKLTA